MRKLLLWIAVCALGACSSSTNSSSATHGGTGDHANDAGSAGRGDDGAESRNGVLERPPGSFERPPEGLPADLRPPKE